MTLALVSGCNSTNPSERTDEVGQVLTIPPRSGAPRVFAHDLVVALALNDPGGDTPVPAPLAKIR